jgi:PKD domain/FG-GAP repeat
MRLRFLVFGALALTSLLLLRAQAAGPLIPIINPAPAADARFGTGIAGISDVTADGIPDLVVGAPGADTAFVLSGSDRSVVRTISDPEGKSGLEFGYSVAGIGDITGDGVDDVAIGAPGPLGQLPLPCLPSPSTVCPPPEWGRVFLFNGASGALVRKLVPPSSSFFLFGFALANLGDVNSDGVPDLAAGSPVLLNAWGSTVAFSGANGAALWSTQEPGPRQAVASFGLFLATIGDVNGDGRKDLVVAAPFFDVDPAPSVFLLAGKAFVLSGATGGILREHSSTTPVDNGHYGGKVGAIGDQNADGIEDYLTGDRAAGVIDLRSGATGAVLRAIPSPADESGSGAFSFARAGDRDGDGKEDFWVGAGLTGSSSLVNGVGTVLDQVLDPGVPAPGSDGFGSQLAATGDLNGDSKPDLLIAKPAATVSGTSKAGVVYLITSNSPPDADAGPDQVVSAGQVCLAVVTLDGSGSTDPDGDALSYTWTGPFGTASGINPQVSLGPGAHTITLTVDDGNGGTDSDSVTIAVVDTAPPTIASATASPNQLWPPNHKMQPVTLSVSASDNCSAVTCQLVNVVSNEPANGIGDGDAEPDWLIGSSLALDLRAERSGLGNGRTYSIAVECVDEKGNTSSVTIPVTVPNGK